ncbi:MAG: hypothetical protein ACREDZ_05765, partial [Kiloniellales bacterium]
FGPVTVPGLGLPSRMRRGAFEGPWTLAGAFLLALGSLIAIQIAFYEPAVAAVPPMSGPRFLLGMTLLQALLGFALLAPRGGAAAFAGALALGGLTFVQAPGFGVQWCALLLALLIAATTTWLGREVRGRIVLLGFLATALTLLHPLVGFLVAVALISLLLCEGPRHANPSHSGAWAHLLMLLLALALGIYLFASKSPFGTLVFGFAPLAALIWALRQTTAGRREVSAILGGLAVGAALLLLPLVAYGVAAGLPLDWWQGLRAVAPLALDASMVEEVGYFNLLTASVLKVVAFASPVAMLQGALWAALTLAPFAVGLLLLGELSRAHRGETPPPLAWFAVFCAPLALVVQLPLVLLFGSALTLVGYLALAGRKPSGKLLAAALVTGLVAIGLAFPLSL